MEMSLKPIYTTQHSKRLHGNRNSFIIRIANRLYTAKLLADILPQFVIKDIIFKTLTFLFYQEFECYSSSIYCFAMYRDDMPFTEIKVLFMVF